MAPSLVLSVLFTFYPTVASWVLSAQEWSGVGDPTFVGWANYVEVVRDEYFWAAMGRTFQFAIVASLFKLVLALFIAIVLNNAAMRLRAVFRTMIFLPVVTTAAVMGAVAVLLLNPFDGPLNQILTGIGLLEQPVNFLGNPDLALWSVAGVWVWKGLGITMVFWLVALQTVPRELYEASWIDGASGLRSHLTITMPLIVPFALLISLLTFASALQTFPLVQTMTRGGPNLATELVELYIFRIAFAPDAGLEARFGYASAVAVVFGVSVLLVALLQLWGVRRMRSLRAAMGGQ
ncbi:carbohydrate ABC transporter permease [Ruania alba]|nr:sugar ABC transporter permease [Ruania alba]